MIARTPRFARTDRRWRALQWRQGTHCGLGLDCIDLCRLGPFQPLDRGL